MVEKKHGLIEDDGPNSLMDCSPARNAFQAKLGLLLAFPGGVAGGILAWRNIEQWSDEASLILVASCLGGFLVGGIVGVTPAGAWLGQNPPAPIQRTPDEVKSQLEFALKRHRIVGWFTLAVFSLTPFLIYRDDILSWCLWAFFMTSSVIVWNWSSLACQHYRQLTERNAV